MLTSSFTVTPSVGNVYVTDYTFTDTTTGGFITNRAWDFGDGTIVYNTSNPVHVYNYPGVYNVQLTAVDIAGNISVATTPLTTDFIFRDSISFVQIPDTYADPGVVTKTPFIVSITSAQINQDKFFIDLFAANSNSIPHEFIPQKWNFLTPTWRFTDENQNIVTSLTVSATPIYVDGRVAGTKGEAKFYFIDDTSTGNPVFNCPLLLAATLQTSAFNLPTDSNIYNYPSYSNSKVARAVIVWQVNDVKPDFLKVTGNYIDQIYPRKWTGIKIPVMITGHGNRQNKIIGAAETQSGITFTYPSSNTTGLITPVTLTLSGVPSSYYRVDEEPLYFQKTDAEGFPTGGYIFTTVTPLSPIDTTVIQASTVAHENVDWATDPFPYPSGYSPNPFVWISNPEASVLNKITLVPYPDNCEVINYYKENKLLVDGQVRTVNVPSVSVDNTFNYSMSGFGGIYGMAIDPREYALIATDAELERIYKFDSFGNLLSTIELSSYDGLSPLQNNYTPGNISIDRDFNTYVSLFNAVSVLKLDPDLNYVKTLAPSSIDFFAAFDDNNLLAPPTVETDRENNVWVTYAHPLCSILAKFNSSGELLYEIKLDDYSVPVSLAVNADNSVWVANSYNVLDTAGTIQQYSTSGTLIKTLTGFMRPAYLSVDRKNNLWFTYGIRNLGFVSSETGETKSWLVSSTGTFVETTIPEFVSIDDIRRDEELGGLGIDVYNRVWVIDSLENTVHILSAVPTIDDYRTIKIVPDSLLGFYTDIKNTYSYSVTGNFYKSAQANGDWTGNKWYQKYVNPATLSAVAVSGISTPFSVFEFNNTYQVERVNEDFSASKYLQSLALPDNLNQNTNLFDKLFGAAAGTALPSEYEDLGQTTYERIANFIFNHADVDTCNIPQLISLASETGVQWFNYGDNYPAEIQRFLDIASVPKNKLWGIKSPLPLSAKSIGTQLNVLTDYLTAGTKVFLRNKFTSEYTLITVPVQDTLIYPISSFTGYGLLQPVIDNYLFYSFNPVYSEKYIENLIDWENPYTTLNPYASTVEEWYGERGAIENAFNYLLTKNLVIK